MDIRDILKSFDQLTEGDSTVHKAGPGGYGNRHGTDDVTDQYGKPIGRTSLAKMNDAPAVKRGKGRPPKNADSSGEVKSYDSSALSKAMGMGKAPKPKGKPSVKHSLKEYFDQMDGALSEAGLAVQPMPATPAVKAQQQMATKPSFMIKDPANPNMPAITTQDPAVVQAAKNGTMSMQKPGAAPTAPGATPAAGAGSQVKPMGEDQLDELSKDTLKSYLKKSTGRADKFHNQGIEQDDDKAASPYFDKRENVSQARRGARDRLKGVFHPKEAPYGMAEDQLDELSKDTLKSYLKKSTGRADKFHNQGIEQDDDKAASPYFDKRENVSQARRGARDRLKGVFHPKEAPYGMAEGGDVGKHNNATTGFDALVRKLTPKYGKEAATKIAGSQLKKMKMHESHGVAEADELRARGGLAAINKNPRPGQTDLRNIPAGNYPGSQNKFTDKDREEHPANLKAKIKATLGKHTRSNLPEQGVAESGSGDLDWKSMITPNADIRELQDMFHEYNLPRDINDFLEWAHDVGSTSLNQAMKLFNQASMEDEEYGSRVDADYRANIESGYYHLQDLMQGQQMAESGSGDLDWKSMITPNADIRELQDMFHEYNLPRDINDFLEWAHDVGSTSLNQAMKLFNQASMEDEEYGSRVDADYRANIESGYYHLQDLMQGQQMAEAEAPQYFAQSSPLSSNNRGVLESKKGVNPFAKKDTKKKPDADKDGVPDWADKKPGKDDNEGKKKGAAPKKGVNPFAKKDEKKKVKEGMEHNLQAARLQGKSHALRKMPYNCTNDDMEEARCYHDGFKEGLDECYGQMPILGRTSVGEMGQGPEVATMASYGADDMGEAMYDEGNAFTAGLAKTPHGGKFKVGGSSFTDNSRYDSNLDEFAFEALDKQLNAILEDKKVSEGMTVSISKGQQGSPDSVSVSAQDGEADQLLSIIKSAGMGLFGGDEQNGYGAPQGSAGAHGGISVVDDHDGMMALMKKLSGNGEMQGGGDYEDEEGSSEEGHMHGEETCESCGGMMEENHQCDSGEQSVMGEDESEDQMAYEVAEANAPDSGADNTNADVAGNSAANNALATADAGADEEEGQVYSSPTEGMEDTTGEEAGTDALDEEEKLDEADNCKKCDCNPCKCETVAESFANLYKKLAFLSEESTSEKDAKAEKAGKKVAKDIEYDEGHKGKDDNKAEKAGKKVTKDIEYDDKKDKKVDESYANSADDTFEADIDFMTKIISGGLNRQKSTGQTTIPVISGQKSRMGVDGLGSPMKESTDLLKDYMKLSGL